MKIGFIGLGKMGSGMAERLLAAGHEVTAYNRTAQKAQKLAKEGAKAAGKPADACRGEAVITMLADDNAVEEVTFGADGILENLGKGAVHISMSTISIGMSERLTSAHAEAGQQFVAAPVFGRPEAAAAGKLFIFAGGKPDAIKKCMPLFEAMGQQTFNISAEPKAGNIIKLSGNFMAACVIESLAEAMALVEKAGIDRKSYINILTSTLFSCPIYKTYGTIIAERKFEPAGFSAPLGEKDMRLALGAAQALRVPMPIANILHDRFLALLAQGGEKLDWSAISQLAAKDAGLE